MSDTDPPVACDLTAIPEEDRERHAEAARTVLESIEKEDELSPGYAFRLPAETRVIEQTGAFLSRERLCRPFFRFELTIQPDGEDVWMKLTGDSGVKTYIENALLPELDR